MATISQVVRFNIYIKDDFTCSYCNRRMSHSVEITLDHIVPKHLGGKNIQSNMVTSCKECNLKKGTMLLTDFIKKYKIPVTQRLSKFL